MKAKFSLIFFFWLLIICCLSAQIPEIRFMCGYDAARIQNTEKSQRPLPAAYLDKLYIKRHLAAFENGASYLVPKEILDKYGREKLGRADGQFVMSKTELDSLLKRADGNLSIIEKDLGIPENSWKGKAIRRIDIINPKELQIRIPSGKEAGANNLWLPGGYLPTGYKEAVINPVLKEAYQETEVIIK